MTSEIGDFLRAKRARLRAEECGLPVYGQRRVPGLRREEVAQLAGVSVDYYVRLEQGRARAASDEVLDAIARTLRLDTAETAHLRRIARPTRAAAGPASQPPRAGIQALLDSMTDVPAFVLSPSMDILATNLLGEVVLALPAPPAERNAARQVFLDPKARDYYLEWEDVARETVAHLRRASGQRPGDRRLRDLIGELTIDSPNFVHCWARQEVLVKSHGTKLVQHPEAGRLAFDYETLELPGDAEQLLVTYVSSDLATRDTLTALGAWNVSSSRSATRAD